MSQIITADNKRSDGVAHRFMELIETNLPILLLSRSENLDFNEHLLSLKDKKYIVADYIENGWQWDCAETLIVGKNTTNFKDVCQNEGWERLHDFIAENPPSIYFKRELLQKDCKDNIVPIEYPNWNAPIQTQSKDEFNARPISAFNFWGRSHEARVQLHGDIWKGASKYNYSVCDNIYYYEDFLKNESGKKYVSLSIPHYKRVEMGSILFINRQSKLSFSLPGAGIKCFRSTGESPVNSVMICKEDNLAWTHSWVHRENCIKFHEFGSEVEAAENALTRDSLYYIYRQGVETANKYGIEPYKKYLEQVIKNA